MSEFPSRNSFFFPNQTVEVDQLLDIFTHTLGSALRAKIAWAPRESNLLLEVGGVFDTQRIHGTNGIFTYIYH